MDSRAASHPRGPQAECLHPPSTESHPPVSKQAPKLKRTEGAQRDFEVAPSQICPHAHISVVKKVMKIFFPIFSCPIKVRISNF